MNNKIGKDDRICGWDSQQRRTQLPLLKQHLLKGSNILPNIFDFGNRQQITICLPRRKEPKSRFSSINDQYKQLQLKAKLYEQNKHHQTPKSRKQIYWTFTPTLPKINSQRVGVNLKGQQNDKKQQNTFRRDTPFIKYNMSTEDIPDYKLYKKLVQHQQQDLIENRSNKINEQSKMDSKGSKVRLKLSTIQITHKQVLQKSRRESKKRSKASIIQNRLQGDENELKRNKSNVNTQKINKLQKKSIQKECPQTQQVFSDKSLFASKSQNIQPQYISHYQQLRKSIEKGSFSSKQILSNKAF